MPKQKVSDLITPSVVVDLERLEKNISDMATRAKEGGINLRPHIKTHKCIEIGKMQVEAGAYGITVSTIVEAIAFADAGFSDITYAVPIAPDKFKGARQLSERTHLNVLVDHPTIVDHLGAYCKNERFTLDVLVKVDSMNFSILDMYIVGFRFLSISRNSCTDMYTKDLIWYLRTIYNSQIGDKRYAD